MTTDQPRTDGLPQGHPEHLTQSLRLVTLHAVMALDADGKPDGVTAEMLIHPTFSMAQRANGATDEQIGERALELLSTIAASQRHVVVPVKGCASCGGYHLVDEHDEQAPTEDGQQG